MCDSRTIRRDVKNLKEKGIIVPTRGTEKDIGPGVTHRGNSSPSLDRRERTCSNKRSNPSSYKIGRELP